MKSFIDWIRNLDIRKVAFVIGFAMLIEKGIVDGDAPLDGILSAAALAKLVAVCKLLLWVNGIILVGHTTSAVRWPTPQNPKINNMAAIALAVGLAALVFAPAARAQTAPVPLPPILTHAPAPAVPGADAVACVVTSCTGFYVGGNLINLGANFDVVGSGLTGLAANGVMGGLDAGYQFWNGQWFAGIELNAEYSVSANFAGIGTGTSGQYALGSQVKVGYSLAQLFGASTNGVATPTLPDKLAAAQISPYLAFGVWDRPWGAGILTGAGVDAVIASNWTLGAEYLHINYNNAAVNSNVREQSENMFMLKLDRHFAGF